MAARKKSHRYLGGADGLASVIDPFEFDEAEIWSANDRSESGRKQNNNPRLLRKPVRKTFGSADRLEAGPKSLPVNIPDWSKILKGEYRKRGGDLVENDDEEEEDDGEEVMPPHEFLARARGASFSVHEGVGRTLKGRDLSRVRNAIWKQTGLIED